MSALSMEIERRKIKSQKKESGKRRPGTIENKYRKKKEEKTIKHLDNKLEGQNVSN